MIKIASYGDMHLPTLEDLLTILEQAESQKDVCKIANCLVETNAPKELLRILWIISNIPAEYSEKNEYYISEDEYDSYYNSGCSEGEY